jgi:two-component system, chemotaxis family, CheB/CheR fusion protein
LDRGATGLQPSAWFCGECVLEEFTPPPQQQQLNVTFPIAAIASSAGGLEALSALLEALPAQSDMAFVVVAHLSAEHESVLPELLGRKTAMAVQGIADGMRIQADRVYVIPPNTTLTIKDERLQLRPRERGQPHHPADILFTSLAEERAHSAIGIVLSGADADGAQGVRSIRLHGGLTFAQEPGSARFPSMPSSAIDTGCIDFVLRPAEIARELGALRSQAYLRESSSSQAMRPDGAPGARDEEQLTRLFRRLRAAQGVDFSHYKRSTIHRRLARRMAVRKVDALGDYLSLLEGDPAEVAALYQDFLIRVTHFFRDPEAFDALRSLVFPRLCEGRSSKESLRIWVPGCATGEEVYSIAITLMEYLGERLGAFPIQIFGSDLSESAIEKARAGLYLNTIAEEVSPERLERFFTREEDSRYRIIRRLRDLCIFSRQDVTYDPPFSKLDLLSSRNLLIYLDPAIQRRVMQTFHYALRPTGFLLLGPSESVGAASDLFDLIDKSNRIYARKTAPTAALDVGRQGRFAAEPVAKGASETDSNLLGAESAPRAADRLLLAEYAPASLLVDEALNILQIRGETGPYLELASGVPSLNLSRVARPELLIEMSPAIAEARETGARVRRQGLRVDEMTDITLQVIPLKTASLEPTYLIVLEDASRRPSARRAPPAGAALPESEKDRRLAQLERELVSMRQYMQAMAEEHEAVREELKSANEEVLSSNEEFQSTNEELETAKEELQSANEELATTNDELRERNRELGLLNDDVLRSRGVSERARAYADAIVETVREPLLVLDAELRVLRANRAFYVDFNTRREDLEGRLLAEIGATQWNATGLLQKISEVVSENIALSDYDLSYTMAPGAAPRTLRINARKIAADKERAELILLAVEDITERRATAAQLREADQRKDEFLAMLAHELRNPLTPITHAMVLLRRREGAADPTQLYELIERQVARLKRLVDELLDIARISHGHIELRRAMMDLVKIVKHAAEASRPRIEERQHVLSMTLPETSLWVQGDEVRLEQVVSNLLENAAKYTEPGGRIALALTQAQGEAVLSVQDNGIGIACERLENIFDLFTQVDSSLARSAGGLGIGLTLVRRVLELHGGRIEARSAGLGHGSEFIVHLPTVPANPAMQVIRPEERPADGDACRVLIVDDNDDVAHSMAMLARSWGHEVAVARNGATALEIAERFQPQRALVDIGLPVMDGYEVARRLRAAPAHPDLYLVAMTGYGQAADREKALAAGFDRHLVKPGDPEELREILANGSRYAAAKVSR